MESELGRQIKGMCKGCYFLRSDGVCGLSWIERPGQGKRALVGRCDQFESNNGEHATRLKEGSRWITKKRSITPGLLNE